MFEILNKIIVFISDVDKHYGEFGCCSAGSCSQTNRQTNAHDRYNIWPEINKACHIFLLCLQT